jgi:hypothetical protein
MKSLQISCRDHDGVQERLLSVFLADGILKDCESFTGRSVISGAALLLLGGLQQRARNSVPAPSRSASHEAEDRPINQY